MCDPPNLDEELFDLRLDRINLWLQVRGFVRRHRGRNHGTGNTTCTAQRCLGWHKHVRHILVFAKQGKMQQNLQRLRVSYKR